MLRLRIFFSSNVAAAAAPAGQLRQGNCPLPSQRRQRAWGACSSGSPGATAAAAARLDDPPKNNLAVQNKAAETGFSRKESNLWASSCADPAGGASTSINAAAASCSACIDVSTAEPAGNTAGEANSASAACQQRWDAVTKALVHLATLAVLADVAARAAAQAATGPALHAATWVGLASNLTSFLILSSVFVSDGELEVAVCYMAGLAGTMLLLAQAFLLGAVPAAIFWPALLLAAGSTAVNAAKLAGHLEPAAQLAPAWRLWRRCIACVGWAMVPQVAYLTLLRPAALAPAASGLASCGPAAVSLGLGAALVALARAGRLPPSCWRVWDVAAWTATLLFMMEPVAALAEAARTPGTLAALSPADFLLPALATGLQVPRALRAGDHMWFTGTSWSTLFACLQAALAAAAQGGLAAAAAALGAPLLAAAWLLQSVAAAQGLPSPLHALSPIAAAYRRQMQPWRELAAWWRQAGLAATQGPAREKQM